MANCLVCGKKVDEERWLQTGADICAYEGKTHYFCGLQHKMKFSNQPQAFLSKKEAPEQPAQANPAAKGGPS